MAWKKKDSNVVEEKITKTFNIKNDDNINNDATKNLKLYNFSFPIEYHKLITNHFKKQGKGFSTSVREILIRYMQQNNII